MNVLVWVVIMEIVVIITFDLVLLVLFLKQVLVLLLVYSSTMVISLQCMVQFTPRAQVQSCGNIVCNTHHQFGDKQLVIADGYYIPLAFKDALAYMPQQLPTNKEIHTLPHVIMTNEGKWNPRTIDDMHLSTDDLLTKIPLTPVDVIDSFYDMEGNIVSANHSVSWTGVDIVHPIPESNDKYTFVFDLSGMSDMQHTKPGALSLVCSDSVPSLQEREIKDDSSSDFSSFHDTFNGSNSISYIYTTHLSMPGLQERALDDDSRHVA